MGKGSFLLGFGFGFNVDSEDVGVRVLVGEGDGPVAGSAADVEDAVDGGG